MNRWSRAEPGIPLRNKLSVSKRFTVENKTPGELADKGFKSGQSANIFTNVAAGTGHTQDNPAIAASDSIDGRGCPGRFSPRPVAVRLKERLVPNFIDIEFL
jgi:hypothetical protein